MFAFNTCIFLHLQRDFFHSIRFKVNKVRGQGVVPFFISLLFGFFMNHLTYECWAYLYFENYFHYTKI